MTKTLQHGGKEITFTYHPLAEHIDYSSPKSTTNFVLLFQNKLIQ